MCAQVHRRPSSKATWPPFATVLCACLCVLLWVGCGDSFGTAQEPGGRAEHVCDAGLCVEATRESARDAVDALSPDVPEAFVGEKTGAFEESGGEEGFASVEGVERGVDAGVVEEKPEVAKEGASGVRLPVWQDNPCTHLSNHTIGYGDLVSRWQQQDSLHPPRKGGLVVVGSSSIRLWKRLQKDLTMWQVTQRGFGGARLWDVVAHALPLVIAHQPRGVLLFAGTNDIAAGTSLDEVLFAYRCLVQNIRKGVGHIPIAFIGITPTPSRWGRWSESSKVNTEVQALAAKWSGLHYIDTPSAFLKTGQPPATSLFQSDLLHLNAAGYQLWTSIIRPAMQTILPPLPYVPPSGPGANTRALVDLGPNNAQDGAHTTSPDTAGQHWNNWHAMQGGSANLPGEALLLVDTKGSRTPWRLIASGSFQCNGLRNGGLQNPSPQRLGSLAVGTATQDYFYVTKDNDAGFVLTGLDPTKRYSLRLFASRASAEETRFTRYTVTSAQGASSQSLKTTGAKISADGSYDGNDAVVIRFADLQPDAWGKIHLDVAAETGAYGYLSLLEVQQQ